MSDMEKAQQIGELVQLREEQKKNLNHLKQKGDSVASAYRVFGSSQKRWGADPSRRGVYFVNPEPQDGRASDFLLSREELAQFVLEFKEAERALAETNEKLAGLGISL